MFTILLEDVLRDLLSVYVLNDFVLASSPGGRRYQVCVRPVELEGRVSFVSYLKLPKEELVVLGLLTAVVAGVDNKDVALLNHVLQYVAPPSHVGDPTAFDLPHLTNRLPPSVKLLKIDSPDLLLLILRNQRLHLYRVAEVGSFSAGAKMAIEIFVRRVFTIF